MEVCIIGGGTSGWWTAGYLRKNHPELKITLIESSVNDRYLSCAISIRPSNFLHYQMIVTWGKRYAKKWWVRQGLNL